MILNIEDFNDYTEWTASDPGIALTNDTDFVFDTGIALRIESSENMKDQTVQKVFSSEIDLTDYSELRFQIRSSDINAYKFTKLEDFYITIQLSLQSKPELFKWYIPIYEANLYNLVVLDITDITLIDTITFTFNTNFDKTFWLDYMVAIEPEMEFDLLTTISNKLDNQVTIPLLNLAQAATIGDTSITLSEDSFLSDGSLIKISESGTSEYHQIKESPQSLIVNFTDLRDGNTIQKNFSTQADVSLIVPADFKNTSKEIYFPSITIWGFNPERAIDRDAEANHYFDYLKLPDATFNYPFKITTDKIETLYVTDSSNHTIRKINLKNNEVSTFAGKAPDRVIPPIEPPSPGYIDGIGTNARFNAPTGIITDGTNIYLFDFYNFIVRKIAIDTALVTTFAGTPGVPGTEDGIGTNAKFNICMGMTIDNGNIYVADSQNSTIRKIVIATAEVTTFAGSPGQHGSVDGIGSDARFGFPYAITTDYKGNLFVCDPDYDTIRKIVIETAEVTTFAGTVGVRGYQDGIGTNAKFSAPGGIISNSINLYITDIYNYVIRKIVIDTAEVSTLAGTPEIRGIQDGIGSNAKFDSPIGITLVGQNLYVVEYEGQIIRKIIIPTTEVTTPVGIAEVIGSIDGGKDSYRVRRVTDAKNFNFSVQITCESWSLELLQLMNNFVRSIFANDTFFHVGGLQINYDVTSTNIILGTEEESPHSSIMILNFWTFENYERGTLFNLLKSTPVVESQILSL